MLEDYSILIGGTRPDKDIYTLRVVTRLSGITGFKLETLVHDSLPGKGPGRHDPDRPNFVLNEFSVMENEGTQSERQLQLHSATTDFSQARFDVAGAIDGKSETAWAINPQFGKPHWAQFLTRYPIDNSSTAKLTFTLDHRHGGCRNIGRLRISAMTGNPGKSSLPDNIAKIIAIPNKTRTKKQTQDLTNYFVSLDGNVKKLQSQIAAIQKQLDTVKPPTTLVMIEQDKPRMTTLVQARRFSKQRSSSRSRHAARAPRRHRQVAPKSTRDSPSG